MPAYSTSTQTYSIAPGDVYTVWNAESPATAAASKQVAIVPNVTGGLMAISCTIVFSADPGTFQVELQESDVDVAAQYITPSGATMAAVNATFAADLQWETRANFARLLMQNDPSNSVTVTATIAR